MGVIHNVTRARADLDVFINAAAAPEYDEDPESLEQRDTSLMQTHPISEEHHPRHLEIIYHGLVWAFVGALYAAMFVPAYEAASNVLPLWISVVLATIAATVGGALVYSSAQLAVHTAFTSNIAVFGYLLMSGVVVSPLGPTVVGAGAGAITGASYGFLVKESKIYRAGAKLMAGLVAGGAVSVIGLIWVLILPDKLIWLIALLAPVSGVVYLKLLAIFVQRYSDLLPPFFNGAVAGIVLGGFIGFGLWLMGGVALEDVVPDWRAASTRITEIALSAIVAASMTTLVLGLIKAAFKLNWGNPYDK